MRRSILLFVIIPALEIEGVAIKDLIVFPNSVQNKLTVQSANNNFDSASITDLRGSTVLSMEKDRFNEIDVSALKFGMFFLNIYPSEGNITKKFRKYF